MSEYHTNNPRLYEELGIEDILSDTPLSEVDMWGDYANRVTDSDVILSIRREEATGEFDVIPISVNGAEIVISGTSKAKDAFFHPNISLDLAPDDYEDSYWDQALDALNELGVVDKAWAIKDLESMGRRGKVPPTLVFDIVKRHKSNRQLDQAA